MIELTIDRFLLAESAVITGKYQNEGLDSTDRARKARSVHRRPRSDIFL